MNRNSDIAVVGGGIAGMCLALNLHQRGLSCTVYERVHEMRELGVGITLLPHAMREFSALGVGEALEAAGVANVESCFFNRFGQLLYKEKRGRHAGYPYPEVSLKRGRLHGILFEAAAARIGAGRILTGRQCIGIAQEGEKVRIDFQETSSGRALPPAHTDIVVACDGVNSTIRKTFYPGEELAFAGINSWRGVTRHKPILTGRSYMRIGSIRTGKIVVYPIADNVDGKGNQLVNWMAEIERKDFARNDWNEKGKLEDFHDIYKDWKFDWLDVGALIQGAEQILEYPMVDRDPVPRWSFGRVTLAGDAAHPMYPRGSNGAAQAAIDSRILAECLAADEPEGALKHYEALRLPAANRVVEAGRSHPPDVINIHVEDLVGDRPFDDLDKFVSQTELRTLSEGYKRIAGFSLDDLV